MCQSISQSVKIASLLTEISNQQVQRHILSGGAALKGDVRCFRTQACSESPVTLASCCCRFFLPHIPPPPPASLFDDETSGTQLASSLKQILNSLSVV